MHKENAISNGFANKDTEFKTVFLMEDCSLIGSIATDQEGHVIPVTIALSKEFLQFYEKKPLVDYILTSVSCGDNKYLSLNLGH